MGSLEEDLKGDLKNFLWYIWKFLGLPEPTPVQYEIADYLQQVKIRRKIIEAFRGEGKSWITSAYVLWRLLKDPDYKGLVVSASKSRADDFTSFTKRLIKEVPVLKYLQPREGQRDSMIAFDVSLARPSHAPSIKSVGVFGQLAGSRATEVIADDCEIPNNSATQDMREKLLKALLEFEAIIIPITGQVTYLGTPQTEESVYNKLKSRGYDCRMWPSEYPKSVVTYGDSLAESIRTALEKDPSLAGKPTDPKRFNELDLMQRRASYGRSGYALQFMLDTTLSDCERYPLKTGDLVVTSLLPDKAPISIAWGSGVQQQIKDLPLIGFTGDRWYAPLFSDDKWSEYEGSVMYIDPSGRGADETSYAVVKQLHGNLFLTAAGGYTGGYDETTLLELAKVAKEQKVNLIQIEPNFGDGMFTKIFTPILHRVYPCAVEEADHSTTQKEKRIIDTLEPVMNRHKLIVDISLIKNDLKNLDSDKIKYSLFYQLSRLTKDRGSLKHDDRIEALQGAVGYWVNSMARDEGISVQRYHEEQLEKELEAFMGGGFNNPRTAYNWLGR